MNISKFTQKSVQAVQDLEKAAYEFGNQEIEQEHLLYNLVHQEDSLILKMIEKMEINKEHFLNNLESVLNARVKVSGGQVYIGQYLNKALVSDGRRVCFGGTSLFGAFALRQSFYEEVLSGVWHHQRAFFAGFKYCSGKSAGDNG